MKGRREGEVRRGPEPSKHMINEAITASQLLVIDADGTSLGVISRADALVRAQTAGLDLVQVGLKDDQLVIAKIMDHGKLLYEKRKQDHKAKKSQKVIQIKELKFRPMIGDGDYQIKMRRAEEFLREGKRVKCTLQFRRGREMVNANEVGEAMFARINQDLQALSLGVLLEEKEQRGKIMWTRIYYLKGK